MKKFLSVLLACILIFSISTVYAADYSSMSDDELYEQYTAIRNELTIRGLKAEKKTVILEKSGVQIYISDSPTFESTWSGTFIYIPVVIVNNTEFNISVVVRNSSINGWTAEAKVYTNNVPSGKKAKTEIRYELKDTDIESLEDFEDAELAFVVYNDNDWFGNKVVDETKPITIYAKK